MDANVEFVPEKEDTLSLEAARQAVRALNPADRAVFTKAAKILEEVHSTVEALAQGRVDQWTKLGERAAKRFQGYTDDEIAKTVLVESIYAMKSIPESLQNLLPTTGAQDVADVTSFGIWGVTGMPNVTLTPDFFHALAVTDFGDPTDEPLRFPFNAFTLTFPASPALGFATKAFIYKACGDIIPKGESSGDIKMVWDRWNLVVPFRGYTLCARWDVSSTRSTIFQQLSILPEDAPAETHGSERYMLAFGNLLANLLTYIEAHGDLPSEKRKHGAPPQPVERIHKDRPLYEVGRTIKLDGGIRKALAEAGEDRARWKLASRFIVRGHWRNQPYGPKRELRKRTWIEPFFKGPEDIGEALRRTYEVT